MIQPRGHLCKLLWACAEGDMITRFVMLFVLLIFALNILMLTPEEFSKNLQALGFHGDISQYFSRFTYETLGVAFLVLAGLAFLSLRAMNKKG